MAFATHADVAIRLGRSLTTAQQSTVTQAIESVTGQITDAVDRDADWAAALDPVPLVLKELCIGKAINALSRPEQAVAATSLGAYSVTYAREHNSGVFLSPGEERLVRMAVYGSGADSSSPRSVVDRLIDLREGRDVDEEPEDAA